MRGSAGLFLALAFSGVAFAGEPRRAVTAATIDWAEPLPGVEATAGESLAIAWRPRTAGEIDFEEWEAFLSLDGGVHWPYRLTPHLDRTISRFVVELPQVASSHARLMLRYGDEREERELLAPFEFTVAAPRRFVARTAARLSEQSGEPARQGEQGVVAWVDGPRDGAPLVRVESAAVDGLSRGPELALLLAPPLALVESAPASPPSAARAQHLDPVPTPGLRLAVASELRAAPGGSLRLALLGRRNE